MEEGREITEEFADDLTSATLVEAAQKVEHHETPSKATCPRGPIIRGSEEAAKLLNKTPED